MTCSDATCKEKRPQMRTLSSPDALGPSYLHLKCTERLSPQKKRTVVNLKAMICPKQDVRGEVCALVPVAIGARGLSIVVVGCVRMDGGNLDKKAAVCAKPSKLSLTYSHGGISWGRGHTIVDSNPTGSTARSFKRRRLGEDDSILSSIFLVGLGRKPPRERERRFC